MIPRSILPLAATCLALPLIAHANEPVPLITGDDLSGWVNMNTAESTWVVKDGVIHCSGQPNGLLRTAKPYENFILELDYRHTAPPEQKIANAGIFIWADSIPAVGSPFAKSVEVQVLDGLNEKDKFTSHGDIFPIFGATMTPDRPHPKGWDRCLPSEERASPRGEWTHYKITANDGTLKLEVNGKEVSGGSKITPRKGFICLEAEGSTIEFRNLMLTELPSTGATAEESADLRDGFVPIFNGIDMTGWKMPDGHEGHWKTNSGVLQYDGKSTAKDKNLWSEKEYGDFTLICDWRWTGQPQGVSKRPVLDPNTGEPKLDADGRLAGIVEIKEYDSGIYLRGSSKSQVNMWNWPCGSGEVYGYRTDKKLSQEIRAGVTPSEKADHPIGKWNRFEITMEGELLTVVLNGKTVIDNARLPGVPERGPIALQHHGSSLEFRNVMIKKK